MPGHRRKRSDDPKDQTEVMSISVGSQTKEKMKEQADKLGISLSHLADRVFVAYLQSRRALTST